MPVAAQALAPVLFARLGPFEGYDVSHKGYLRGSDRMADDNEPGRLLLGMRGWPCPHWRGRYFPEDLPQDWEFAFYSNDAGCLLLPAADWLALEPAQIAAWLDDCEPWFRFFLEDPGGELPPELLQAFGGNLGGVLCADAPPRPPLAVPQWRPVGSGEWAEVGTGARLCHWDIAGEDLRVLRHRFQALPARTMALVLTGEGETPERLREVQTLAELLGLA